MKKRTIIFIFLLAIAAGGSFMKTVAQEKPKSEKEKELQVLKEIEEQKKALAVQKREADSKSDQVKSFDITTDDKASREFKDQKDLRDLEVMMKDLQIDVDMAEKAGEQMRNFRRNYRMQEPFVIAGADNFHGFGWVEGGNERSTWEYSRSVKENSFSREFSFDVDKTVTNVVMSVMGDCKDGSIRIKILAPTGKVYSDIVIDEFGNLNWRKSFTVSNTENQDKTGEWKFKVESEKATGFFKISLQTY